MKQIAIISASIRDGRLSHRVALFMKKYMEENQLAKVDILDLKAYDFPLFTERLMYQKNPTAQVLDYVERFNRADAIIIVSPVYNTSFPAALKNVIDLLVKEWRDKVVAVSSVTYGTNAGIATVKEIQALMLYMGAQVVPASFTALNAGTEYDEAGSPADPETANKRVGGFIRKLLLLAEQTKRA
ncbi:NAD(P)H-dependent FMN reductase [Parabacteroides sp. PFB2-10]|uniref:NADPH-dependent FMN reductase n=1 Tax=Parabacteroides sp. PFB2-10 TaxID=1742405 RepID=UPI00247407AD|nr:NAD(P)H-dependent oxidoreductase [Parabacteroides sp. PFB2-10]MDH6313170.1 NAD(P)H-dependent FMN reductase [Parabacteroides sp. PFB2-10]